MRDKYPEADNGTESKRSMMPPQTPPHIEVRKRPGITARVPAEGTDTTIQIGQNT